MEVNYNIDKAVEDAYQIGRKENIFINNYCYFLALTFLMCYTISVNLKEE
mgnify:CR=1 FL=1